MAIKIENKVFQIETEHTSYQMKVDEYGVLNHLWYGAKTNCCMDYLLDYPDVGFSGNIYEAGDINLNVNGIPMSQDIVE